MNRSFIVAVPSSPSQNDTDLLVSHDRYGFFRPAGSGAGAGSHCPQSGRTHLSSTPIDTPLPLLPWTPLCYQHGPVTTCGGPRAAAGPGGAAAAPHRATDTNLHFDCNPWTKFGIPVDTRAAVASGQDARAEGAAPYVDEGVRCRAPLLPPLLPHA